MAHYRITIKLENEPAKEFVIEDERNQIDLVFLDYRSRARRKNGAGRVVYFDLVMIAEESVKNLKDREEVFNTGNDFGLSSLHQKRERPNRKYKTDGISLGDRIRKSRK